MTSPTGRARGFSLLEVLITLAIIALFSGYFLLRFEGGGPGRVLEDSASQLQQSALFAKKRASAFRRDHFVLFDGRRFVVTDRSPTESSSNSDFREFEGEVTSLPAEVTVEILRFGERRWVPLNRHAWRFRSSGLNEPLGLRLSAEQSFVELQFDALTGLAEEESVIE